MPKVAVVTGATAGIGLGAAKLLGELGYRLVLVGRNRERGAAALALLRQQVPDIEADFHYADLALIAEMHRLGAELAAAEPKIDLLVNNAGAMFFDRRVTLEGFERTFAVNHLAYYVVTRHLIPILRAAAPARIVSVSSGAHRSGVLDFDDLQTERNYSGMGAYRRSKLANILFTRALAHRLDPAEVTANCLHPGFIASSFADDNRLPVRLMARFTKRLLAEPVEVGAGRVVHVATAPEVAAVSGKYFTENAITEPAAAAQDDDTAERLWRRSEELSGSAGLPP